MKYKVTALNDVTVLAYVRSEIIEHVGAAIGRRPAKRKEWVSLRAGEVREGLGMIVGVHPRSCPGTVPTHIDGLPIVMSPPWSNAGLPKEFFGLFRLEVQTEK